MDRSSGKRGTGGSVTPRKRYSATPLKEAASEGNQSAQFCNRIGCSGRMKLSQNARMGISDKSKYPSSGNEVTGKSSRSSSVAATAQRSCHDSNRRIFAPAPSAASPVASASNRINGSRYGLRNLRCNSVSDATPPSCSQLESEAARKGFYKKRSSEGESSSSTRGRRSTASPNMDRHTSPIATGVIISDSAFSSSSLVDNSSGSSSTWNRRPTNASARIRFSARKDGRNSSPVRDPAVSFSRNEYEIPLTVGDGSSSQQFSLRDSRPRRRSSNNSENSSSGTSFASAESELTQIMNRDVLRQFNMDGIAEVLMALERIEQDEELTHEQILALETGLFLSGLNLYDQHRGMRLDIENMSYEELLALEERMGSVSTALSEEALSKCLIRSIYEVTQSKAELTESGEDGDSNKCSICQEEYIVGDEIGSLVECRHGYHATCINQWLQHKNWCPVCKASAAPSQSSSSS